MPALTRGTGGYLTFAARPFRHNFSPQTSHVHATPPPCREDEAVSCTRSHTPFALHPGHEGCCLATVSPLGVVAAHSSERRPRVSFHVFFRTERESRSIAISHRRLLVQAVHHELFRICQLIAQERSRKIRVLFEIRVGSVRHAFACASGVFVFLARNATTRLN